jgi:hypothetical protein
MELEAMESTVARTKKTSGPAGWKGQPTAFTIRGCDEWKDAIRAMAKSLGMDVSGMFDMAARELARRLEHPKLPDRLK